MSQRTYLYRILFACLCSLGMLLTPTQAFSQEADSGRVFPNILYRADNGKLDEYSRKQCRIDLYVPAGVKDFPTIIWYHGGGLTAGHKSIPRELTKHGVAVAAVGYRLSPQVAVKECLDDAAVSTAWILQNIQDYGGAPNRVVVSGHSAGGYLTLMITLDRSLLKRYGSNPDQLAGSAPLSSQTITHFTARKELGIPEKQPFINEAAPLFHVRPDTPPILLVTGDREKEMLGRYEENAYLWRMFKVVGQQDVTLIEIPGADHGGMVVPGYPHLLQCVSRVTAPALPLE